MANRTFVVRDSATKKIQGVFCARGSNDLLCLIDERIDPFDCEYMELAPGQGVFVLDDHHPDTNKNLTDHLSSQSVWTSLNLMGFLDTAPDLELHSA